MTAAEFEAIWMAQVAKEKAILLERADAYATNGDRLGNFYEGARLNQRTPMAYAFMLVSKHIIALRDLIAKDETRQQTSPEKLDEYVTDIRNYAVLIQALYCDRKPF